MALLPENVAAGGSSHIAHTNQVHKKLNSWINVKADFGAVGDNIADDTAAIQAALDAVPTVASPFGGGVVFFPPGVYRITAPLVPKAYTHIVGSEPASRYWARSTSSPPATCAIRLASTGWTGAAMFLPGSGFTASSMRDIALLGGNVGTNVHGIDFGTSQSLEMNFRADNLAVIGFTGDGIRGRLFASRWTNCFFGGMHGYGLNATTNFVDSHWVNCYIAGCDDGGLNLDGTSSSGLNSWTDCRFERSGWNSGSVLSPFQVGGSGIRIRYANDCRFTSCDTDANSGPGVDIALGAASTGRVYNVHFVNCQIKRDGFGDMATLGEYAGVKVRGFDNAGVWTDITYVHFTDCDVLAGKATDDGSNPTYTHPKYSLWFEHTIGCTWNGGRLLAGGAGGTEVPANRYYGGPSGTWEANNDDLDLKVFRDKLLHVPHSSTRPTNGLEVGAHMFDNALNKPIWYDGGGTWRDATGAVV